MANSVLQSRQGPLWPLGSIVISSPGTPRNMMSVVDPSLVNSPSSPVPGTVGANEYTVRAQQIVIQGVKSNGGTGFINNTGNIYVFLKGSGSNNRTDTGCVLFVIAAGQTLTIGSSAQVVNVFNPYLLWIDADNGGDAAQVTLIIQ